MACDTTTLLTDACTYGYTGLSDRDLKIVQLVLLCNGGGGGGGGGVTSGNGPPVAAPSGSAGIYFDLLTGVQYNYYDGSWH